MTTVRRDDTISRISKLEPARILYITFDGVLEPLGRSQVLSYLLGLSRRGFKFTLISLEREHDLSDNLGVAELERELADYDVKWLHYSFHSAGVSGVLKNFLIALRAARLAVSQDRIALVHCRSYVPALIGWVLNRFRGIRYLFDMRGYWIDELADEGRWFRSRTAYKIGKRIELSLLKDSAAIVTLTELQARDLRSGELKHFPDKPILTITTCADYDEFRPQGTLSEVVPEEVRGRLQEKLVVGLVGSINASYCIPESLCLFGFLLKERPDAHLLCLTRQLHEMEQLLRAREIPREAYTLATVPHQQIAEWLRLMDWALLLLNTRFSKRGSMPTKLAEFFSSGVRPVQYGCNEEVSENVRLAGSGIVLASLAAEDLRKAALTVASTSLNPESIMKARETTRPHFSLEAGVNKYAELIDKLLLEGEK
jgi:glycosyltransferase involved in cell wall biosynthesis